MKITSVEAHFLCYPLPEPIRLSYYGGERTIVKRDAMLVRVVTDKGIIGYAPGQASPRARKTIQEIIGPFLMGRDPSDPKALRKAFQQGPGTDPEDVKVYGSVEIALYDLAGKIHNKPVSELLGGRVRERIQLYASAGMYMEPEGYAAEAALAKKLGFKAYKMRPGRGPDKDLETVRQMREAVGADFELMVDAHTWWRMGDRSYPVETVERLARDMAKYRIAWLEESMPPDDHDKYVALTQKKIVPVASGEHEPSEERFLDLIHRKAVNFVQMDIVCQGGYVTAQRLMPEIERAGQAFAFHSWGSVLEVIAAAHVGICYPHKTVPWLEYPCYSTKANKFMYPFPLATEILKKPLPIENGDLVVPRGPGLGVEVDESVIERYPWIEGPWSFFKLDSPPGTWAVTADHSAKWG
jgi:L-alanine-DL-glutamate epimerase-like enolase superfamily enzyme